MPPEADDKTKDAGAGASAEPEISFKTKGEFHAEVNRKTTAEVKKALESRNSEILGQLGLESFEELSAFKEKLAVSEKTVSEAEKLKAAHDKTSRDLAKAQTRGEQLTARLKGIAKRDALAPYTGKVVDAQVFAMLADSQLDVDDDGAVSVKDGGKLDDMVESLLKSKPYLRVPDVKPGAGTNATEPKAKVESKDADKDKKDPANDDKTKANGAGGYQSMGHKIMAELAASGKLPTMPGP